MRSSIESGKAWQYGLAIQFRNALNATIKESPPKRVAEQYFASQSPSEKIRICTAAKEVVVFLKFHELRTDHVREIEIQSDKRGQHRDVRDILIHTTNGVVGLSAKHRLSTIKYSRLSIKLDFGEKLYATPCSSNYWAAVTPIFDDLEARKGSPWCELVNKHQDYYLPVLQALMDEISARGNPELLMQYLLGRFPFYKVIKDNGTVKTQSFNFNGSLGWGRRINLPQHIVHLERPMIRKNNKRSLTTAVMYLDEGWQVSFCLHSTTKEIEPSFKFEIKLIGAPVSLSSHEIPYESSAE